MNFWNQILGRKGESLAQSYLKKQGYRIVDKRWKCKQGEIDLIAWDRYTLCFIEVKTREESVVFDPVLAVDKRKQKQIIRVADIYLARKDMCMTPHRFDIVAVTTIKGKKPRLRLIKDAFWDE